MPEPKTLADVEAYVACRDEDGDAVWKDEDGFVLVQTRRGSIFLWNEYEPHEITITRVLGPLKPLTWEQQEGGE